MASSKSGDLADLIFEALKDYSEDVDNIVQDEVVKLTKEVVKDLKNDDTIPVRRPEYKKSFFFKKKAQGRGFTRTVIANEEYRMTHLLENAHDIVRGGKVVGRTKAFPHWDKAQKKVDMLPDIIKERLTNGR